MFTKQLEEWEKCKCPICNVMIKLFEPKNNKKSKQYEIRKN
tara:strand:- start:178 stop:300 length:123 start_codon:yes stop_codon:yes gene_type:complete